MNEDTDMRRLPMLWALLLWLTEMVVACVRCLLILIAACVVSGWSWLWVVAVRPVCCLVELAVSQLTRKTWAFLARAMMRYEMGLVVVGVSVV